MRTLSDLVFNRPLAIEQGKLDIIVRNVVLPRLGGADAAITVDAEKSDRKPYSVTPDGVALIDVGGTLVRKASGMNAWSGLTSYQKLSRELSAALADADVRGILLRCDSPGGEVAGLYDVVDEFYAARGQKPIYAVASEMAFSAAYAIASAADRIFITRTGGVGSIGIVCCHVNEAGADAKAGLEYEYVFCGDHKIDGNPHEPLSDGARSVIQRENTRCYNLLVQTVARNRGLTLKAVKATEAGLYFADDAIDAGLADEIGTEDDACAALVAAIQGSPLQGGSVSFGNAKSAGRKISASGSPGLLAAASRLAGRKTETPPAPRQASSGLVRACRALSRQTGVETSPENAGRGGLIANCIAIGRRRRAEATQRPRPTEARSNSAQIEALPRKARKSGLMVKALAIRNRMEAEAGQKPGDAPTGGVAGKCAAIAARMGARTNGPRRLEEEVYNA
jgi:signal peptide peptidase SppA